MSAHWVSSLKPAGQFHQDWQSAKPDCAKLNCAKLDCAKLDCAKSDTEPRAGMRPRGGWEAVSGSV